MVEDGKWEVLNRTTCTSNLEIGCSHLHIFGLTLSSC